MRATLYTRRDGRDVKGLHKPARRVSWLYIVDVLMCRLESIIYYYFRPIVVLIQNQSFVKLHPTYTVMNMLELVITTITENGTII